MKYPLQLSRSGDFIEGLVDLPLVTPATDLVSPIGGRPALFTSAEKVGTEFALDVENEQAWAALQMNKAHRYWQTIKQLIAAGKLALSPGLLPLLASKSAAGLFDRLPLIEWQIGPLKIAGGTYAMSAAAVLRRFEDEGRQLPQSVWDELDRAVVKEALEAERRLND